MKKDALLIVMICALLPVTAFAETNKTHVTDSLSQGDSRLEVMYGVSNGSAPTDYLTAGGTKYTGTTQASGTVFMADYFIGVTDRLNLRLQFPASSFQSVSQDIASGANKIGIKLNTSGQGDMTFGAQYQISDKMKDGLGWTAYGTVKPATAGSSGGTAQTTLNGTVTTAGQDGQSGSGTIDWTFGTAFAPGQTTGLYLDVNYTKRGSKVQNGQNQSPGGQLSMIAGFENLINDRTTITPSFGIKLNDAGSYGTYTSSSYTDVTLGLSIIHDVSKGFSILGGLAYVISSQTTASFTNGDLMTLNSNANLIALVGGAFFF